MEESFLVFDKNAKHYSKNRPIRSNIHRLTGKSYEPEESKLEEVGILNGTYSYFDNSSLSPKFLSMDNEDKKIIGSKDNSYIITKRLIEGIPLTQFSPYEENSDVYFKVTEDYETIQIDPYDGRVIEFPVKFLKSVDIIPFVVIARGDNFKGVSTKMLQPRCSKNEVFVLVDFNQRKIVFSFPNRQHAETFKLICTLLWSKVKHSDLLNRNENYNKGNVIKGLRSDTSSNTGCLDKIINLIFCVDCLSVPTIAKNCIDLVKCSSKVDRTKEIQVCYNNFESSEKMIEIVKSNPSDVDMQSSDTDLEGDLVERFLEEFDDLNQQELLATTVGDSASHGYDIESLPSEVYNESILPNVYQEEAYELVKPENISNDIDIELTNLIRKIIEFIKIDKAEIKSTEEIFSFKKIHENIKIMLGAVRKSFSRMYKRSKIILEHNKDQIH